MGRGSGGDGGRTSREVAFWNKLARFGMMRSRRGRFIPLLCVASDSNPRRHDPQIPFKNPIFGPLESGQTESGAPNFLERPSATGKQLQKFPNSSPK